ncbi:MAG: hypothetical protein U0586_12470 [Candidatus Brocadiaceae bacterium]
MTRTMRFDGTLHVVIVHCILSLCIAQVGTGHCDFILSLRAKRSNLSLVNKQYLWDIKERLHYRNLRKREHD